MSTSHAPGPRGLERIRSAVRMSSRDGLLPELERAARVHGDVVRFALPHAQALLLNEPEAVRHVLLENARNYVKGPQLEELRPVVGKGLLTSEGDFWLRQRRLAQPAFHHGRVGGLAQTMVACTGAELGGWEAHAKQGRAFDVSAAMNALTLEIVGRTLFSVSLTGDAADVGDAVVNVLRRVADRACALVKLPRAVPTPSQLHFRWALSRLKRVVDGIITQRRSGPEREDLLGMLLAARDDDGRPMTDRQLRDEAMTLLLAGHETTANALSWTFLLLSRFPAVERRLAQEVRAVTRGRPLAAEDVMKLGYARQVLQESMRLYPPAWLLARAALGEDEVGGYRVPKGAMVLVSPYLLHRHPRHWENPEGFDPDRFAPERAAARARFVYLPFGGGPRVCIGNEFALMEAVIILASVVQRYRLELVPHHPVELEPLVTLRPRFGIQVVARRQLEEAQALDTAPFAAPWRSPRAAGLPG